MRRPWLQSTSTVTLRSPLCSGTDHTTPGAEAYSGFVRTVVPRAGFGTAPAHSMAGHPQKTGALHRLAPLQKVQDREDSWGQRLADSITGKFALLEQQHSKAEPREQI